MASIHTLCQQALTYTQAQEDLVSSKCVCQCWLTALDHAYFFSFMFTCTVLLQCDQLKHVREAMSEQRAGKEALPPPTPIPYFHFQSDLLNLQNLGRCSSQLHRKSDNVLFLTPHLSKYTIVSRIYSILCWNFGFILLCLLPSVQSFEFPVAHPWSYLRLVIHLVFGH